MLTLRRLLPRLLPPPPTSSLQDIFGGFVFQPELGSSSSGGGGGGSAATAAAAGEPTEVETLPTLLVTREVREHANVYHTYTGGRWAGRGWWAAAASREGGREGLREHDRPRLALPACPTRLLPTFAFPPPPASADMLNVYITLRMLGWEHSARQVGLPLCTLGRPTCLAGPACFTLGSCCLCRFALLVQVPLVSCRLSGAPTHLSFHLT